MTESAIPRHRQDRVIPAVARVTDSLEFYSWPLVRIVAGAFLVPHGAQKLFGAFGGGGLASTIEGFHNMGFQPGWLMAPVAASIEFFGGILIAIGLLTRPAAVAGVIFMTVAMFVHLDRGFFWTDGGWEFPAMWLALLIAIAIRGGGELSIDRAIGKEV